MGEALGDQLHLGEKFTSVDPATRTVNGRYQADCIVNSIPWTAWTEAGPIPDEVRAAVSRLGAGPHRRGFTSPTRSPPTRTGPTTPTRPRAFIAFCFAPTSAPAPRAIGRKPTPSARPPLAPGAFRHTNEYAYPVNTLDKPRNVETIKQWAASQGIYALGRWGQWEHMNSDVATSLAISAARELYGLAA